ncbi:MULTISPECIES: winged helix-turn-helix transcriptional regulator [Streptomyces]|uniref:winged helix-turn-helix transcriptional regulator n=1 Tax=Streptomyces TaxID=1883 RepID=UPI000D1BC9E9
MACPAFRHGHPGRPSCIQRSQRRVPYQEPGDRQRFAYELTEQGQELRPTLVALLEWGDKYLAVPEGPSVIVRHRPVDDETRCDEPVAVTLGCAAGHTHLPPEAVYRAPGPGARFLDPAPRRPARG